MVKNLPTNAKDMGLIPGLGRFLGVGNGNPLQYSCLENFAYVRTAHMTDVLHTYHHSQEYTKVLMKFLKVDGIHEEHHRLFSILYS